jgi:hypothetical protein
MDHRLGLPPHYRRTGSPNAYEKSRHQVSSTNRYRKELFDMEETSSQPGRDTSVPPVGEPYSKSYSHNLTTGVVTEHVTYMEPVTLGPAPLQWERVDQKYRLKNVGGDWDGFARRVYCPPGKRWPRISVCLYPELTGFESDSPTRKHAVYSDRVSLSVNQKTAPGHWWEKCAIPFGILGDVLQMLNEFHSRQTQP